MIEVGNLIKMRRHPLREGISLYYKPGAAYVYTPDDFPVMVVGFKIFNSKTIHRNISYPFRVEVLHDGLVHQFRFKNKKNFYDFFEKAKEDKND